MKGGRGRGIYKILKNKKNFCYNIGDDKKLL